MQTFAKSLMALLLLFPFLGISQEKENEDQPEPMKLEKNGSWNHLVSEGGVDVHYKYMECHSKKNDIHKERVALRFNNTNDQKVSLEWDHLMWYDGQCKTCNAGRENHYELELAPNEKKEGSCDFGGPNELHVFSRFLNPGNGRPDTELTGFRLGDLKVE